MLRTLLFAILLTLPLLADAPPSQSITVAANVDTATATVHLSGINNATARDFRATVPPNDQKVVPETSITLAGAGQEWDVTIKVDHLASFGETLVSLLYQNQVRDTVRFFKAGLNLKQPDGGFVARQDSPLTLVLENPAATPYPSVRARLRFQDQDACEVSTDQSPGKSGDNLQCNDPAKWGAFPVTAYTTTTLRMIPLDPWFLDPQSGYPRSDKRKGLLTLRYPADPKSPNTPVFEQNIPLEVQFNPSGLNTFRNLLRIAWWLSVGAFTFLLLRVTIPNYRRKHTIKDRFDDAAKSTRAISDGVNSVLRVLLRVERLALKASLRNSWIIGPTFADTAQLVERGLDNLANKITFARQLDTAQARRGALTDPPPTRLHNIERHLDTVSEALLQDELGEQDRVLIKQHLDSVEKLLGEPSQEEKDAFEALLVQRWSSIRDFFTVENGKLKVPEVLKDMEDCFPRPEVMPVAGDGDGAKWVKNIGFTRADLQLSALDLLRDFQFLAPASGLNDPPWPQARKRLQAMLETPAVENLASARLLLRELSQRISADAIRDALRAGQAEINVDPQTVSRNEKTRLFVYFRNPDLNTAAARLDFECEWELTDRAGARGSITSYREHGWEIYHYFEYNVGQSDITVRFSKGGELLTVAEPAQGQAAPAVLEFKKTLNPLAATRGDVRKETWQRNVPEALQVFAGILVPLATLAITQASQANTGNWWDLVGIGFGTETIRNILTGTPTQQLQSK